MSIISQNGTIVDTQSAIVSSGAVALDSTLTAGLSSSYVGTNTVPTPTHGTVPNLVNSSQPGITPLTGVTFHSTVVSPNDGVTLDGVTGYVAIDPGSLPTNIGNPFSVLFSYKVSAVSPTVTNLYDLTDGVNHFSVKIPANTSTIQVAYGATLVTTPSNSGYTSGANTVLVICDGVSKITVYVDGYQVQTGSYTPASWVPSKGTFGAVWNGTAYTGFSAFGLGSPALWNSALTTQQVLNVLGMPTQEIVKKGEVLTDGIDSTPGYLSNELVEGPGISLQVITNPIGNDVVQISTNNSPSYVLPTVVNANEAASVSLQTYTFNVSALSPTPTLTQLQFYGDSEFVSVNNGYLASASIVGTTVTIVFAPVVHPKSKVFLLAYPVINPS